MGICVSIISWCECVCAHAPPQCVHLSDAACGCGMQGKMCVTVSVGVLLLSHTPCPPSSPSSVAPSQAVALPSPLLPPNWSVRGGGGAGAAAPPPLPIQAINSSRAGARAGAELAPAAGAAREKGPGPESWREELPTTAQVSPPCLPSPGPAQPCLAQSP